MYLVNYHNAAACDSGLLWRDFPIWEFPPTYYMDWNDFQEHIIAERARSRWWTLQERDSEHTESRAWAAQEGYIWQGRETRVAGGSAAGHTEGAATGQSVGAECGSVLPLSQGQQAGDVLAPFCGQALGRSTIWFLRLFHPLTKSRNHNGKEEQ